MATSLSHFSVKQLADEAINVGKKLLELSPSSAAEIINILAEVEQILVRVQQSPSRLVIKALDQIITALIAKELVIHPDVDVNISVASCICDVLKILTPYNHQQMNEFFELVVVTFEKLTSTRGGCYTKMMKVLETLSSVPFMDLMPKCLQLDRLIVRLFKQFLTVADSNSSAVVSKMEQIMTIIMGESEDLDKLAGLLTTSVKKKDQIASLVSCQLGEKVLENCADRLSKTHRPDMSLIRCQNSQSEMVSSKDPPKAVKKLIARRNKKVHGEDLVGVRIQVWWPADKKYYEGVVESFDCSEQKHTVLYDDGDIEQLDLKEQQWELAREVVMGLPAIVPSPESGKTRVEGYTVKDIRKGLQMVLLKKVPPLSISSARRGQNSQSEMVLYNDPPMPSKAVKKLNGKRKRVNKKLVAEMPVVVSSPESGVTCVQGYTVKKINAPILESIFKKHGDIAATCVSKTPSLIESMLEVVCEVVRKIQTNDVATLISDMEELLSLVSGAEAIKINVAWLRAHLEAIQIRTEDSKNCSLLIIAAEMDLKKISSELEKAKRFVEVLNIVKKNLNDNFLEWKAEKYSWVEQPMLLTI